MCSRVVCVGEGWIEAALRRAASVGLRACAHACAAEQRQAAAVDFQACDHVSATFAVRTQAADEGYRLHAHAGDCRLFQGCGYMQCLAAVLARETPERCERLLTEDGSACFRAA